MSRPFFGNQTIKIKLISLSLDVVNLVILFFLWFRKKPCNKICRQKLPDPLQHSFLDSEGKSLEKKHPGSAAKGQTEAHKHLPHLRRCGIKIFQLSENPMGFAKNRNSSKLKKTRPFLAHDRSCFGAKSIAKSCSRRNF